MSLVKWIRKNNRKLMVFVVIFCMVSFVVGSVGLQIIFSIFSGSNKVIAAYDGGKIRQRDYMNAQNELKVLRNLRVDQLLVAQGANPQMIRPGYLLLLKLLFPDSPFAGQIDLVLKQATQQGQLQISETELNKYFNQPFQSSEIIWLLLRAEAHNAGCAVTIETARQALASIIPQLIQGQTYSSLIQQIIGQSSLTEDQILRVFSDYQSILIYADYIMDNHAVTTNQVKAALGRTQEKIDADFAKIPADWFVDEKSPVSDDRIQTQFDAYKNVLPNFPTPENPYGFGYKLPQRVQLEYMVIKMDDVTGQISKPTQEEMENYYSRNIEQFQDSTPSDPNDDTSEPIVTTRSYAEVQGQIRRTLEQDKTVKTAGIIFNDIKDQLERGFETISFDEATADQLQMAAGDYTDVAKNVAAKHSVPVVTAKTGWLDMDALRTDGVLNSLSKEYQQNYVRLADVVYNVVIDPKQPYKRRIGVPTVRIWENIGPFSGGYYDQQERKYHRLMALVRVVGTQEAQVPADINVAYDIKGTEVFESQKQQDTTFSLKENIADDLRMLDAMEAAKARAEEFAAMTREKGWDDALKAYNEKYAQKDASEDDADTQEIRVEKIQNQLRLPQSDIEMAKRMMVENPAAAQSIQRRLVMNMRTVELNSLLGEGVESTGMIQKVMPFEPEAAYYVVKEVRRKPATMADYLDKKDMTAFQMNMMESADLPLIHFSTENILKRMDYEYKMKHTEDQPPQESTDENKETAA